MGKEGGDEERRFFLPISFKALIYLVTPLCPAGHLPHKEGDRMDAPASPAKQRSTQEVLERWEIRAACDLPTCGGDGRQARGG
ncbi:hypothetical protein JL39_22040, partial [Rhizobium sp. YS-1r]